MNIFVVLQSLTIIKETRIITAAVIIESGAIDKLTRGVYCLPEVFDDEFAAISYRWSK